MKQDRFLIGILIGITVLVLVSIAIFFTRKNDLQYGPDDTPDGVVRNYIVAVYKRDYQKAYMYLSDNPGKPSFDQFYRSLVDNGSSGSTYGIEVGQVDIQGDTAIVSLGIVYTSNDPFSTSSRITDSAMLVAENGTWKITRVPYNLWGYDWYQPTSPPLK